jgi:hypothetical protein
MIIIWGWSRISNPIAEARLIKRFVPTVVPLSVMMPIAAKVRGITTDINKQILIALAQPYNFHNPTPRIRGIKLILRMAMSEKKATFTLIPSTGVPKF